MDQVVIQHFVACKRMATLICPVGTKTMILTRSHKNYVAQVVTLGRAICAKDDFKFITSNVYSSYASENKPNSILTTPASKTSVWSPHHNAVDYIWTHSSNTLTQHAHSVSHQIVHEVNVTTFDGTILHYNQAVCRTASHWIGPHRGNPLPHQTHTAKDFIRAHRSIFQFF